MGKFYNGDKSGGGKKKFGNDKSGKPQMHKATCCECGNGCEVPFRPTGAKPVFCSFCFEKKETSGGIMNERRSAGRPNFKEKQMFRAVCSKCHTNCEVPFKPTSDKKVYCSACFGKGGNDHGHNNNNSDQYKRQFEMLDSKLDRILKMLTAHVKSSKDSE